MAMATKGSLSPASAAADRAWGVVVLNRIHLCAELLFPASAQFRTVVGWV
jgi:hypothetical protein